MTHLAQLQRLICEHVILTTDPELLDLIFKLLVNEAA